MYMLVLLGRPACPIRPCSVSVSLRFHLILSVVISLLLSGVKKQFSYSRRTTCRACGGKGASRIQRCPECGGSGMSASHYDLKPVDASLLRAAVSHSLRCCPAPGISGDGAPDGE